MYALNRVQIIGHLVQDPDIRQTPSGQSVGDLVMITKYVFKDNTGVEQEGNAYHYIVVWRGLADVCGQYLRQGSQIYIAGRLQTDSWEDEAGQKRYKTKIIADEMIMLDSRNQNINIPIPFTSPVAGALNKAEIIGNLTKDPELRQTPNGAVVCTMGVATNYSWKDKEGQTQEKTEFHNVVVWDRIAEEVHKYLKKGRKLYVSGRLQTRAWETPEGIKKYSTEIIADNIIGLGTPVGDIPASSEEKKDREKVKVAAKNGEITEDMIPEINYGSEVKPEDLPF
jgi:single-strand DNA-binding protein